jgi:hypothetical protein
MNERIKELADQVGLGTQHNGIVLTKNVNAAEAFEQFALLIVQESADWINENVGLIDEAARVDLLKHFGAES